MMSSISISVLESQPPIHFADCLPFLCFVLNPLFASSVLFLFYFSKVTGWSWRLSLCTLSALCRHLPSTMSLITTQFDSLLQVVGALRDLQTGRSWPDLQPIKAAWRVIVKMWIMPHLFQSLYQTHPILGACFWPITKRAVIWQWTWHSCMLV